MSATEVFGQDLGILHGLGFVKAMSADAALSEEEVSFAVSDVGIWSNGDIVALIFLVVLFLWYLVPNVRRLLDLWCEKRVHETTLAAFIRYRFGYWVSWTGNSNIIILTTIVGVTVPIGATAYMIFGQESPMDGTWKTFLSLVAPDGGVEEEALGGKGVGACLSLAGLVVFALLLTFLQDGFNTYIENLKEGAGPVLETGHVLVIGLNKSSLHLISELSMAFEEQGGIPIVVLSEEKTKPEFEADVKDAGISTGRSRLVVRHGHAQYKTDLMRVSVANCRTVIIMADRSKDKEVRDAYVLQAMMVMLSQGWPKNGRILTEVSLLKMRPIIERLGGPQLDIVMMERWMAKLFVQVSVEAGLGSVLHQMLSYKDARLMIEKVPQHLDGKSYEEVVLYYPAAIVLGLLLENKNCRFGPGKAGQRNPPMQAGQDLVLIASSEVRSHIAQPRPHSARRVPELEMKMPPPRDAMGPNEKFLIVGWGGNIGPLLVELHKVVHSLTKIVILSPMPVEDREYRLGRTQRRWQTNFDKYEFEHVTGMLGSPTALDRVGNMEEFTRVFLLADISTTDARHADACTIAAVVQIREMMAAKKVGKRIPMIPEILDPRSERLCSICKVADFIDASGMPVQVLAAVTFVPDLRLLLRGMLSEDQEGSVHFNIRTLGNYVSDEILPTQLSFWEVQEIVGHAGEALVGWTKPSDVFGEQELTPFVKEMTGVVLEAHGKDEIFHQYELNPKEKDVKRTWHPSDEVVVMAHD